MPFHQTDFNKWDSIKIEFVHLKLCKHILGVNRSTSNILVRGEVGRMPLKTAVDTKKIVQYYKHLINSENKLVHQALQLDREMHESQCSDIFTGYINALSHDIDVQGSKGIEGYRKAKVKYMITTRRFGS